MPKSIADLSFYERLFMRGHEIQLTESFVAGPVPEIETITDVKTRINVTDEDLALAYNLLVEMRAALLHCQSQFMRYGQDSVQQLQDAHLSLVERQQLEAKRDRDLGIARVLDRLVGDRPAPPDTDWQDIKTAPQDGSVIRLLGRHQDGRPYVETGRWENIRWSVEDRAMNGAPTHWKPLDRLPKEYLDGD